MKKQVKNFTILKLKDVRGKLLCNTEIFIGLPMYISYTSLLSDVSAPIGRYKTNHEGKIFLSGIFSMEAVTIRVGEINFPEYIELGTSQEIRIPPKKFQLETLVVDV